MDFHPGVNPLPILPDPDRARSPVAGLAWNEEQPRHIGAHSHSRGQIISVMKGVATVGAHNRVWVVPPNRAMWIPAGTEHWVRYSKTLALRSLFTDATASAGLPRSCAILHLDALSRELLNTAVDFCWDLDANHSEMRLVRLLLDRMPTLMQPALNVPDGKDRRVLRIMAMLRDSPDDNRTLAEWGNMVGASDRTLARLFIRDTGMTFTVWRRQHRLVVALEQLAVGTPVTSVAHNLGYETAGNFSTMFRSAFHQSPREYFRSWSDDA